MSRYYFDDPMDFLRYLIGQNIQGQNNIQTKISNSQNIQIYLIIKI